MKQFFFIVFISLFFFVSGTKGQAVTVTNPTNVNPAMAANYGSLSAAITALNLVTTVTGPVIITLNTGFPQTAPAGGYTINFTGATSAANNITIEGSNNIITAFNPQTSGLLTDAIFKLVGVDYITIQHFTMQEING